MNLSYFLMIVTIRPFLRISDENIWSKMVVTNFDYEHFWIHRWIALYVLDRVSPQKIDKVKLSKLIRYSCQYVPKYIKSFKDVDLSYIDLSSSNLSQANLSEANLSYAPLRDANVRNANLSRANLLKADLSRANLLKS